MHFPVDEGAYRLNMGFSAVRDGQWLDRDDRFDADIALKKQLLAEQYGAVFQSGPDTGDGQQAVLDLIADTLNTVPDISEFPPLAKAALMVQEDLVLMQKIDGEYRFNAGCICFPSGWDLKDKIGRGMDPVHAPVPGYTEQLKQSVDRFFANVRPDRKFLRFNWGLFDSDHLFQPERWRQSRDVLPTIDIHNIGEAIWFRVEKQSLQRLPGREDILFTIRLFNTSLKEVTADPEKAARLLNAVQTMSSATRSYKSISRYQSVLSEYLKTRMR